MTTDPRDEVETAVAERHAAFLADIDHSIGDGMRWRIAETLRAVTAERDTLREKLEEAEANNTRWRKNSIDTWSSMNAMRDSINEHLPAPSSESDLLQGPENSIFCAALAEAVVAALTEARAGQAAAWMAGRDAAADVPFPEGGVTSGGA